MLVLSRRIGEKIVIELPGKMVEIVVLRIEPGKVRLGFAGARDISIVRAELLEHQVGRDDMGRLHDTQQENLRGERP